MRDISNGELTFLWVPGQEIGYGRMGVYIAQHLAERGVTIFNDDGNPERSESPAQRTLNGRHLATPPTNLICWASVPSHMAGYHAGQHKAFITMWEAMTLPESFREVFAEIDTMIVPSEQNVELFSRYHDNVHYMPLGVDPVLWHYQAPPPADSEFRFLIAGRGTRKGTDLAYRAFQEVFRGVTSGPVPKLVMKSLKGHGDFYGPNIEHITGKLSAEAEVALYASCHAYVQPSRGEGFGLQPLQAIATGRPTILTDAHGHAGYAHLGIGIAAEAKPAEYFIYGDAGEWWEPSYDELCEAMWDVYKNYAVHSARARQSAAEVASSWTWSQTTDRFIEILGDQMTVPYTGDGTWVRPERRLFRIVTLRDWSCDIAGRTMFFQKGQAYYEPADVKRILFDSGLLDPVCLTEDDHGLAEFQVEQMGEYRASHEHCPTCGNMLNEGSSKADAIYAEMLEEELAAEKAEVLRLRGLLTDKAVHASAMIASR